MNKEKKEINLTIQDENRMMKDAAPVVSDAAKKKSSKKETNKTWEAFGRSKGCFIINDPKFLL